MPSDAAIVKMRSQFKVCLVANFASVLLMFGAAVIIGYIARTTAPVPGAAESYSWLTYSYLAATRVSLLIGLPAFAIAFAGMMRFRLWARQLFTCLMIAWAVQTAGFSIVNVDLVWGIASFFAYIACLTAGAVLAMSYFTPLAELFARPQTHPAVSKSVGLSIG